MHYEDRPKRGEILINVLNEIKAKVIGFDGENILIQYHDSMSLVGAIGDDLLLHKADRIIPTQMKFWELWKSGQ